MIDTDLVAITLEFQKNDKRDIKWYIYVLHRWWDYVPINGFGIYGKSDHENNPAYNVQNIVELMGEKVSGFTKEEVGLHSTRSG